MAKRDSGLDLKGSLVIDKIADLKKSFDQAVKKGKPLNLFSSDIIDIDLTGIQFLHYAGQQSRLNHVPVSFNFKLAPEQRLMLERNGFSNLLDLLK